MSNPYKIIYELRDTIAELSERCREQEADIEELLKEREWISVKDRLPKENIWVLVYSKQGSYMNLKVDYIHDGRWFNSLLVTHWMPLPEPPESEDDAE